MNVLVTGASGQTGFMVLRRLAERPNDFKARGLVRSEEAASGVRSKLRHEVSLVHGDITKPQTLPAAFAGMDAVVIVTSALPQLKYSSLPGTIFKKVTGHKEVMPEFYFLEGAEPEVVDWHGQKNQIDAAKAAGVKHIVLVGSMGGTKPDHVLNKMGNANILKWKRKAERYLMASGIVYTIIHPGGLLPHAPKKTHVPGGERELLVGVDDSLLNTVIPREDVAEVCVQALKTPEARNRSFDLSARAPGEGKPWDGNLSTLLAKLNGANCKYTDPEWP